LVYPLAKKPSKYRFTVIDLPLSEKTQQIQIYSYWFAPERKKPSKYRFTVIGLPLSGKPANTDLQLLVYPLAKKPSKYRFTVIGLPLSEKTQQIQIYSYWFTP
jgi:hypothetical protein